MSEKNEEWEERGENEENESRIFKLKNNTTERLLFDEKNNENLSFEVSEYKRAVKTNHMQTGRERENIKRCDERWM